MEFRPDSRKASGIFALRNVIANYLSYPEHYELKIVLGKLLISLFIYILEILPAKVHQPCSIDIKLNPKSRPARLLSNFMIS